MDFHPVANIFPLLQGDEYEQLKNDIAKNGLNEPIWLHPDGRILDGRNRWRACVDTNTNARFRTLDNDKSPIEFVISENLHRRHLDSSQRAAIAVDVLPMLEKEAKERQKAAGGDKKSEEYRESVGQQIAQPILDQHTDTEMNGRSAEQAAKHFRTNREYVKGAKKLKSEAPDLFEEVKTGRRNVRNAMREHTKRTKADPPPLTGKHRVIYADPPWKYGNTMPEYFTEQADHYPPMTVKEIAAMSVKDITEDNAVLFLWVTSPILEESFEVINSWGFKYKASFVWDKVKHNMGHYNSVRHEFLLIAVRGSCQPDVQKLFDSVQTIERGEHSEKPEAFREIIDTIYPNGKRIELFARKQVSGWEIYGNEPELS